MTHIWHKVLAKWDIGRFWDSNRTYSFVYWVINILESVVPQEEG